MEREQTTIRLPTELMEQLRRQADRRGISFNNLVEIALGQWLRAYQQI